MSAELAWQYIVQGKWIAAVTSVFTSLIGQWFYVTLFLAFYLSLWIKTRNIAIPSVLGLLTASITFVLLPPEVHAAAVLMLFMSLAGVIARAIIK